MITHQKTTEFLLAARSGDFCQVSDLLNLYGKQLLNSQDHFGSSALHMSVMYGHQELVALLLAQPGIKVNLQAYQDTGMGNTYSPLDLSIKYKQPVEMVELLLQSGASSHYPIMLLVMLFEQALGTDDYQIFEQAIIKLDAIEKKIPQIIYLDGTPLSTILCQVNCFIDNPQEKLLMQKMIDTIVNNDVNHYADKYVTAKNFTHAFPSSHRYSTINKISKSLFESEGHFTVFTVKSFHEAVIDYQVILNMDIANYNKLKTEVFSEVGAAFYGAEKAILNAGLYDTSQMIYQLYNDGQAILLPTGWSGHAVDVILDKSLGLYVVANSGEKHESLSSGLTAYNHHKDNPISPDEIYYILNNEDQYNLEYEHYYNLALTKNTNFSQVFPHQEYGNCALNSLLLASWSLIYINIFKSTQDHVIAKEMADCWHKDIVEHHKTMTLKNYLADPYFKDDKALYDALIKYEAKIDHVEKEAQTQLMLDYLTSSEHVSAFESFYKKNQGKFSSDLKNYIQDNGYNTALKIEDVLNIKEPKLFFPESMPVPMPMLDNATPVIFANVTTDLLLEQPGHYLEMFA